MPQRSAKSFQDGSSMMFPIISRFPTFRHMLGVATNGPRWGVD